jgi:hypothetical protein
MTHPDPGLDATLHTLGWSYRHVAGLLDCDHTVISRWAKGKDEAPRVVVTWLQRLAAQHEKLPAPTGWKPEDDHRWRKRNKQK